MKKKTVLEFVSLAEESFLLLAGAMESEYAKSHPVWKDGANEWMRRYRIVTEHKTPKHLK